MVQSEEFLGRLLYPLRKTGLPLIKNVIKALAKSVLISLGLTAVASAADATIHNKILGLDRCYSSSSASHKPTRLIKLNDGMKDFIEIDKSLEDNGCLPEGVSKKIQMKLKNKKKDFLVSY